ncbi:F-box domain protein [Cooperia oncophora]
MDLSLLPEEVLVNVLRQTSPTTVITAKRLNKKLHRIVERNHLAKPRVDDFNVEMRTFHGRTRPIGKLQLKNNGGGTVHRRLVVTMKRKNKSRQVVEEGVEGPSNSSGTQLIAEEMKKVLLYERLSFDGVTADTEFMNMLTAKWNDLK